ncbi:hypothetical protein [Hymenobacter properus]|uniref:Uncharacterized protein n=1 Tax=Hymenobacter properus TaxID=2791026 RepID=A0A931BF69_9BACT|nr:hypothetical protein [Hymenobacter properus]MBF9140561.1 hypothetical protein [Hymenobacter properus]MBR7719368.1 hypothetical protein [Microvirga sp. SRT04]
MNLRTWIFCGAWGLVAQQLTACSSPAPARPAAVHWDADSTSVRVPAGPQYARGAVWRFFWGQHYRGIWNTPVTAPVLRLASAERDSLLPLRAGGSYQSRTLRLRTTKGYQFVLRSIDKDMSAALPVGWKRNLLRGLMKDQTSATLPYGAYVAARLAAAAGVYHANPRLVYLPDDPFLGQFRASYANALYLLEERPEGDQRHAHSFGFSPAIYNSRHLLTVLRKRPNASVDPHAFLRARLLDMWLGDWSRREDQWRWASFPGPGGTRFRPIPRDRDQAFFRFDDGVLTRVLSWFLTKFQSFHTTMRLSNVDALTITARNLDRTLLSPLSSADFRAEADSLQKRLSDAVIDEALKAGPAETRAVIAAELAPLLRARRAQLAAVAQRYFEILSTEAWVVGTDHAERFVLSGAGPGRLRVQLLAIRKNQADSLILERVYDPQTTKQLNLYGLAGDDEFRIAPDAAVGVRVGIYGGLGQNQITIHSLAGSKATAGPSPGFTLYTSNAAATESGGLATQPDAHPELTNNALGWVKHYRLDD